MADTPEREMQIRQLAAALRAVVENFGPWHDEDCPGDDTCDCSAKPIHDQVNTALRGCDHADLKRYASPGSSAPEPKRWPIKMVRMRCRDFREGYRAGYARGEAGEVEDPEPAWDRSKASAEMAELPPPASAQEPVSPCGHYARFAVTLADYDGNEQPSCMQCQRDEAQKATPEPAPLRKALERLVACCTSADGAISPEPADRGEWLDAMVDARQALASASTGASPERCEWREDDGGALSAACRAGKPPRYSWGTCKEFSVCPYCTQPLSLPSGRTPEQEQP